MIKVLLKMDKPSIANSVSLYFGEISLYVTTMQTKKFKRKKYIISLYSNTNWHQQQYKEEHIQHIEFHSFEMK
jgi:hypothetical protein